MNGGKLAFMVFDSANEAFSFAYDALMPVEAYSLQMALAGLFW